MKNRATAAAIAALFVLSGAASAQAQSNQMPGPGGPPDGQSAYGGGFQNPHGMRHHRGFHGKRGGGKGARFTLERGDSQIDIRCAPHESTQLCVDEAMRLIDRVIGKKGKHGDGRRDTDYDYDESSGRNNDREAYGGDNGRDRSANRDDDRYYR